jgi:type IV pilus assembly protein PilY1
MASRRFKWTAAGSAVAAIGLALVGYNLIAAQGQGLLAQEPLNFQVSSPASFVMAVDDSGSMTFQTQFPGRDGEGCWNRARASFFESNGSLNTTGDTCDYFYVMPGARINSYYGVPPLDTLGFARSSDFNPTYYNPNIKYDPWVNVTDPLTGDAVPDAQSRVDAARYDPRSNFSNETIDLRTTYAGTSGNDTFRMQTGMILPAGTRYYDSRWRTTDRETTWSGNNTNVYMEHWPATFFTRYTGTGDPYPVLPGFTGAYSGMNRVVVANACGAGCSMWKYTITTANADALQNFANWFTYYGNRNRAMVAGLTRSMADVKKLRVGYFRINQYGSYNTAAKRLPIREMKDGPDRVLLYSDMRALTASGGTPNRWAVEAAAKQFTRTDDNAPVKLTCQKNAVMLFTDGFSNNGGPTVGGKDSGMGVPFQDSYDDTMADIVTQYYLNTNGGNSPLRADLPAGGVPVPEACKQANPDKTLDCQTNLHLNFYGVTLGARGNLFNPDLVQNPYTDASIYGNWPPRQDDERSTVDDIWHASVNTRGEYINARTPAEITEAMRRVLSAVTAGGSPSGGTGASGARIGAGSISVGPEYQIENEGTDWFSRLKANRLSVDPVTRALVQTPYWDAAEQLQSAASRRIFFSKNGATSEFTGGNVTLADLCTKPAGLYPDMSNCTEGELTGRVGPLTSADAVAYLRGDTTYEKRSGGKMRDRTTRLGDIVTSTPVVSSPIDDFGFRSLNDAFAASYAAYLTRKANDGKYMVYVGANDGMLHAFNGGMNAAGNPISGGGTEAFAYIPSTALGHMGNLLFPYNPADKTGQKFQHKYFVDGQIAVADSFYGNGWHTTLVGSAGAGGRSVFGLDVTPGSTFTANSRLWEISDLNPNLSTAVRQNIGHVLSKPVIVPVLGPGNTPSWKAIFGNGFNSASGKAVLFVVDVETGAVTMIEAVEAGTGVPTGSNGLASIVVIDRWGDADQQRRTRDGYSDTVYGTDQKGAVWKFDLRTNAALTVPLFTTRAFTENGLARRQPITGGITAGTGTKGGVMLYFGTGSFSFDGDGTDNTQQSLYGVNDAVNGLVTSTVTRGNLTGRTIATDANNFRTLTANTGNPTNPQGWYIDLPLGTGTTPASERFVGNPSLSNGIVAMTTYAPVPGGAGCSTPGVNWFFALYPLTGEGALGRATLNSPGGTGFADGTAGMRNNSKGSAPVLNSNPFALPRVSPPNLSTPPSGPPSGPPTPPTVGCVQGYQVGPDTIYVPYPCGRQSWRQIQ